MDNEHSEGGTEMEVVSATEPDSFAFEHAASQLRASWDDLPRTPSEPAEAPPPNQFESPAQVALPDAVVAANLTAAVVPAATELTLEPELEVALPRPPRTPRIPQYAPLDRALDPEIAPAGIAPRPRLGLALAAAAATVVLVVIAFSLAGRDTPAAAPSLGGAAAPAAAAPLHEPRAPAINPAAAPTTSPQPVAEPLPASEPAAAEREQKPAAEPRKEPRARARTKAVVPVTRSEPGERTSPVAKKKPKKGAGFVSKSPY